MMLKKGYNDNFIIRKGKTRDYFLVLSTYNKKTTEEDKKFFHPKILTNKFYNLIFCFNGFFYFLDKFIPNFLKYRLYVVIRDFKKNKDKEIVSFLIEHKGVIGMMTVKEYRNKGFCGKLIDYIKKDLNKILLLSVYKKNLKAIKLYEKKGFSIFEHKMILDLKNNR